MKYFKYILFVFCCFSFGLLVFAKQREHKYTNNIIVIDPGHGNLDVGTSYKDIYEKDINLDISLKLKEKLQEDGVKVLMTRDGDYDLSYPNSRRRKKSDFDNRINYINNSNASMYLSIHINYLNNKNN